MEPKYIRIRGARMHNLKNINVDLPRNQFVVFTGLSGSGKSSLAFDTLYAEGQRRYVESLSTYARQFLGQMDKPDIDSLEGLSPAVSIEQRTTSRNPRSTVGTITEIYDHLRLLFARVGHPYCPDCGCKIRPQSIQDMVASLLSEKKGTKIIILAPLVDARKGRHLDLFQRLRKEGFVRVRVDNEIVNLDQEIDLEKNKRHTIEAVVDRLVIKSSVKRRLAESTATAVNLSEGFLMVNFPETNKDLLFSERSACIQCGQSLPDLSPRLFSFNNPKGACTECGGLGVKYFFDPQLVIPDPELSIMQGAIAPWSNRAVYTYSGRILSGLAAHYGFDLDMRFCDLPEKACSVILNGTGNEEVVFHYERHQRQLTYKTAFEGILPNLARRYRETSSSMIREELARFMNEQTCPACHGARLKPAALAVKVGRWSISELTGINIEELSRELPGIKFTSQEFVIAKRILKEIQDRVSFLRDVGLGYLSLDRRASTLSGGEAQRIRLASQIGSRLAGVLYILDEPSIGLHQRDNQRLVHTLTRLRDLGNTVIVVEHDSETIMAADYVLDMGPGAGIHGGHVVYSGPVKGLMKDSDSVTGGYLSGRLKINLPSKRRKPSRYRIIVKKTRVNNLKNITVAFPLGLMTCVTGVSGSGKSSLLIETLYNGATNQTRLSKGDFDEIKGLEQIDKVIDIDQSPIGRTPRSNPATYTGILTPIRELLSRLPESRARGYKPGRFSFNLKGGRCEACEGDGVIKIAMHFLPDIYVMCETCNGRRYNQETLEIRYKGKNVSDILGMNVEEALDFFENIPPVRNRLQTLFDVGLSYISLGQSSVTLSGGEAQRIKLARELSKRSTGRTLYILDEPTTGLHPADIQHLLNVLHRLVDSGNSVVIIEHNLDVIKMADHIIDLGPEGGDNGGRVVAVGTPEKIAQNVDSHTGRYLKQVLG
ncbi:MAG: excinuclease ABC subunit UvrA [Thermodesulfobacteriota bacterium]|nr:excinuclease ABC subunit UvrA [Thermodesulfobacteriota bacterium]